MAVKSEQFRDTTSAALVKLVEIQRSMEPLEKLRQALAWSEGLEQLARQNIQRLHPAASEREIFLRAAARRLGRELMIKAYGWDPLTASE